MNEHPDVDLAHVGDTISGCGSGGEELVSEAQEKIWDKKLQEAHHQDLRNRFLTYQKHREKCRSSGFNVQHSMRSVDAITGHLAERPTSALQKCQRAGEDLSLQMSESVLAGEKMNLAETTETPDAHFSDFYNAGTTFSPDEVKLLSAEEIVAEVYTRVIALKKWLVEHKNWLDTKLPKEKATLQQQRLVAKTVLTEALNPALAGAAAKTGSLLERARVLRQILANDAERLEVEEKYHRGQLQWATEQLEFFGTARGEVGALARKALLEVEG